MERGLVGDESRRRKNQQQPDLIGREWLLNGLLSGEVETLPGSGAGVDPGGATDRVGRLAAQTWLPAGSRRSHTRLCSSAGHVVFEAFPFEVLKLN